VSEDVCSAWAKDVNRTAAFVSGDFPDVEREDLTQHLFMKLLENQQYLKSPEERGATTMLLWWAKAYAKSVRTEHLQLSPQYSYRTSDIRDILHVVFQQQDWESVEVPDDARSEFRDVFLEINIDVKRAFEKLGEKQKLVIFEKYAMSIDPVDPAGRKRLSRAIEALTDRVNFYQHAIDDEFIGKRRVMSNAKARYVTKNQEEI